MDSPDEPHNFCRRNDTESEIRAYFHRVNDIYRTANKQRLRLAGSVLASYLECIL